MDNNQSLLERSKYKKLLKSVLPKQIVNLREYKPKDYILSKQATKRYQDYYLASKDKWAGNELHAKDYSQTISKSIKEDGIAQSGIDVVGQPDDYSIFDGIMADCDQDSNVLWMTDNVWIDPSNAEPGLVPQYSYLKHERIKQNQKLLEFFTRPEVVAPFEAYLQSHVRLVAVLAYRTFHGGGRNENSMKWHFDNQPDNSLKIMVYPHEVTSGTGEFQYLLKSYKDVKLSPGYGHSRVEDPNVVAKYKRYDCIGPKGNLYYFNNNGLHRGGNIKQSGGQRTVVLGCYRPSKIPARAHLEQYGVGGYHQKTWGPNPDVVWWTK